MRAVRLFHVFEALQAAGPRGLTPKELLGRLEAWGDPIEERQLQRDIKTLRETMGLPIAASRDLDDGQLADGSRVIYMIDRRGMLPAELVSAGRAIACFEATGHRLWGKAVDEGWVLLHRIQAPTSSDLARTLESRFERSAALYLGQFHFDHFVLEVPRNLEHDLTVRIGRLDRARQAPEAIGPREVLIGLEGRPALSRLFGARPGHVALYFRRGTRAVVLETLATDSGAFVRTRRPQEAYDETPINCIAEIESERLRVREVDKSGLIFFGGVVMYLWLGEARDARSALA